MVAQPPSTLPLDPTDPYYDLVSPNSLPPPEAYRYFPIGNDLRNKGQRFVYGGNTVYEKDEEDKYS
jgi:hypothetical protein